MSGRKKFYGKILFILQEGSLAPHFEKGRRGRDLKWSTLQRF
jgi:hypothetical protein